MKDLKKLFQFAISETHFCFDREIYEKVDGVAIGSPLASVLAKLFMGHHEQHWLIQKEGYQSYFMRDMLMIFLAFSKHQSRQIYF